VLTREESGPGVAQLPAQPLVVVRPSRAWTALDAREIWGHRELLFFLTWRDVKIRYKQTLLGVAWAVLQPLLTMAIFTLLFGRLAGMPSEGVPYPLFAYAGLLPWTFFANAVTSSGNSLVLNHSLLTKVYLPRVLIPAAAVAAFLVDFAIALSLIVVLMWWYRVVPTWSLSMIPALTLLVFGLALGIGMGLAALNVRYRDVRHALPFLIQMWMFLSPVIYPPAILPPRWRWMLGLNPLSGVIEGFRAALFGRAFDWPSLGLSALIMVVCLAAASWYFRRVERTFADIA
jgi:lipopolysaccharide transport system permease protein